MVSCLLEWLILSYQEAYVNNWHFHSSLEKDLKKSSSFGWLWLLIEGDTFVCTLSCSWRDTTSQVPSVAICYCEVIANNFCTTTESEHLCSSLSLLLPSWRWEIQNSTSVHLSGWHPVDIQQLKSALPTLQTKTLRLHGMILWYIINRSKTIL